MSSRFATFIRSSLVDCALVLAVVLGVSHALLSSFDATVALRGAFGLQLAIALPMLIILYAGAWSKRSLAPAAAAVVAWAVAALAASAAMMPADVPFFADGFVNDSPGNYPVFVVVMLAVTAVVYLLSRRVPGCAVLAFLVVAVCAGVQFLFRNWLSGEGGAVAFACCLVGSAALLIFQRYRACAYAAEQLSSPAFGRAALFAVAAVGVACAVGGILFACAIQPLGLGTPVIRPFEQNIVRPVIEYTGVYDSVKVENPDLKSSLVGEEEDTTSENTDGGSDPEQTDDPDQGAGSPIAQFIESLQTYSQDSWDEGADPVAYDRLRLGALLAALAVALLAAAVIGARIYWRRVRLRRIADRTPAARVLYLYRFLCGRFAKLGISKPASATPLEFAVARRQDMVPFTRGAGKIDFVRVTLLAQRAAYGTGDVTEAEYAQVERYYRVFFANARREVGTLRWLWLFWKI